MEMWGIVGLVEMWGIVGSVGYGRVGWCRVW